MVDCLKACLVAQSFNQIPGFDFSHMFSPVVKASTTRTVLSIAVTRKWHLHQIDVKNTFLNGFLNEIVYMEQPLSFTNLKFSIHICHLKKALYGLNQAPLAWFQRLNTFLLQQAFHCSQSDTSLFVFHKNSCILCLPVYVDDIILTDNDESSIGKFIARLHAEFSIKDVRHICIIHSYI